MTEQTKTFTCSVAVRNLGAALLDDETQGNLPRGFATRLLMAMLRHDVPELANLRANMSDARWSHFVAADREGAQRFQLACAYIDTAAQILAD